MPKWDKHIIWFYTLEEKKDFTPTELQIKRTEQLTLNGFIKYCKHVGSNKSFQKYRNKIVFFFLLEYKYGMKKNEFYFTGIEI